MATAPNLGAGTEDKLPKKLPIGVLTAETITTSLFIMFIFILVGHEINDFLRDFGMYC